MLGVVMSVVAQEEDVSKMIQLIDLSAITRDSDKNRTTVSFVEGRKIVPWLTFGQAQLREERDNRYRLVAYLTEGVTDCEHDSSYAVRLPLIGVTLKSVHYHDTHIAAWINPNSERDFCVPLPNYDPATRPEAYTCEDCEEPHLVTAYCPPFNGALWNTVRGKEVEIIIGTT